jgi:hypothetical protein
VIVQCRRCKQAYTRYRRDHPPSGYCSNDCHDRAKGQKPAAAPRQPSAVLLDIINHRRIVHGTTDLIEWFECRACDALEGEHAFSIHYWQPEAA